MEKESTPPRRRPLSPLSPADTPVMAQGGELELKDEEGGGGYMDEH